MGDQDGFVFLRSDPDDGESYVLTETAAQYLVRRRRGADSYTTYDIAMESWFLEVVPTLVFMRVSKASKFSLLSDDLMDLSVSFLDWVGSEQRASLESDTAKGMSLRDYLNKGKIKSLKKLKNGISFEDDGIKMFISELARGDYDGDDYEDALINISNHYIGGMHHRPGISYSIGGDPLCVFCLLEIGTFDYSTFSGLIRVHA